MSGCGRGMGGPAVQTVTDDGWRPVSNCQFWLPILDLKSGRLAERVCCTAVREGM